MARFIQAFGNKTRGFPLINLDHIAELRDAGSDNNGDQRGLDAFNSEGVRVGRIGQHDVDQSQGVTVTASPNIFLLHPYFDEDAKDNPRIIFHRLLVVAWVVEFGEATPVTYEALPTFGEWFLEIPDNPTFWTQPENRVWTDRAAFERDVLEMMLETKKRKG